MKEVYISVINDLVTDQRVYRTAVYFSGKGARVTLIGRRLRNSPALKETGWSYRRFRMIFTKGPLFYAAFNLRLLFYLLWKQKPDLLFSNDLDTLPANYLVSAIRKVKLIYDSHEYFTEVPELVNRPAVRKIWSRVERMFLPHLKYAVTVSPSIATVYREKYGTEFRVVRNLPQSREPLVDGSLRELYGGKYIIIYQGSLNVGRGLELLVRAMRFIDDAVLLMAGDGDIRKKLEKMVGDLKLGDRIHMLGRMHPEDLYPITSNADIGISLEEDLGLNYRYALPNKLFDYIQARIPVLCSDLPEMKAVVENYQVGIVTSERDPEALADIIKGMLHDRRQGRWRDSLEKAAEELCWEKESKVLDEMVGEGKRKKEKGKSKK